MADTLLGADELARIAAGLPPLPEAPPPVPLLAGVAGPVEVPGDRAAPPPPPPVAPPELGFNESKLPVAIPVPVPLVPTGTHGTKGSRAIESTADTSGNIKAGFEAGQKAIDHQADAAGEQARVDEQRAQVEAQRAEDIANEQARRNMLAQAEALAEKERRDKIDAEREQAMQQIQADTKRAPAGFHDWSGLEVTLGAVSVLGALVAKHGGGIGPAAMAAIGMIDRHVNEQYRAKRETLEGQYKALAERDGYNAHLENRAKDEFAKLQLQAGQAYDYIGKYWDAQQKALGPLGNNADAQKVRAEFELKKAQAQENFGKIIATKVTDAAQVVPGRGGGGAGTGGGALSRLHEFARANPGPESEARVVQMAEQLFPGMKPAQLQPLVAGAVKASADARASKTNQPALVRDEKTGRPLGYVSTTRGVHVFATRDADYARGLENLEALARDIEEHGSRVGTPEKIKRRNTLAENAGIAVATVSPLGKTDEAMKTEKASIGDAGTPGHGVLIGANLDAVKRKINELKDQRARFRNSELAPLEGNESVDTGKEATPAANRKAFKSGVPRILGGKRYVEVGPDDWQPEGGA